MANLLCSFCRRTGGFPCAGCDRRTCSDCHLSDRHTKVCETARHQAGKR